MAKRPLPKVTEPDDCPDIVHYAGIAFCDAVTLCGKTDWIGETQGEETDRSVTCAGCRAIVRYVHAHARPSFGG